jgi:two-component system invasion response regulator UvrY
VRTGSELTAVLVADDHPIVRRGIVDLLGETADLRVVAEAGTAHEVLAMLRRTRVDVVVLDMAMPGRHGLDVLDHIHREWPALPVLVLTIHPEDLYAVRAFRAGAAGYLTKDAAADELVRAIRRVRTGGRWVSAPLAEHLVDRLDHANRPAHDGLSQREFEILRRIGNGEAPKHIGRALNVSDKTVSTHRARILKKLGLHTTADLIKYVVRHGLAD